MNPEEAVEEITHLMAQNVVHIIEDEGVCYAELVPADVRLGLILSRLVASVEKETLERAAKERAALTDEQLHRIATDTQDLYQTSRRLQYEGERLSAHVSELLAEIRALKSQP